jgi:hypothetical protein
MSKIEQNYKVGDTVELSDIALENENYTEFIGESEKLIITDVYTSTSEHPGFDSSAGMALYSLKRKKTGSPICFDLYDNELEFIYNRN